MRTIRMTPGQMTAKLLGKRIIVETSWKERHDFIVDRTETVADALALEGNNGGTTGLSRLDRATIKFANLPELFSKGEVTEEHPTIGRGTCKKKIIYFDAFRHLKCGGEQVNVVMA